MQVRKIWGSTSKQSPTVKTLRGLRARVCLWLSKSSVRHYRAFDHSEWLSVGLLLFPPPHAECKTSCLRNKRPDPLVTTSPPQGFSCSSSTCPHQQTSPPATHLDRPNRGVTISTLPSSGGWWKCPLRWAPCFAWMNSFIFRELLFCVFAFNRLIRHT